MLKKINLSSKLTETQYTALCNKLEKQGIFRQCGSCDDKRIIVGFENEADFVAWCVAVGFVDIGQLV